MKNKFSCNLNLYYNIVIKPTKHYYLNIECTIVFKLNQTKNQCKYIGSWVHGSDRNSIS